MTIEEAKAKLEAKYEEALRHDFVIDKIGWALHYTWREHCWQKMKEEERKKK